jgi:hypothetical protein
MYTEEKLRRVNKIIKDMVFNYDGKIFTPGLNIKFQYQFKITGQKKMISVGDYYDFLIVSVKIIGGDKDSIIIFNIFDKMGSNVTKDYMLTNRLSREISEELQYFFGPDHVRVHFGDNAITLGDEYQQEINDFDIYNKKEQNEK